MTPFTLSTRANRAQLHGQRTGLGSQLKCGMVSAGYEARLQACDSRRCRNSIPFPIPPLAVRTREIASTSLDGWSYSPANVLPRSARAGFHPGVVTAGADRELVLWPFLTLRPDTAWSPLAFPVSSSPLDRVCLYHGGLESPLRAPFRGARCLPLPSPRSGSHPAVGRGCLCLSASPAFPTDWH